MRSSGWFRVTGLGFVEAPACAGFPQKLSEIDVLPKIKDSTAVMLHLFFDVRFTASYEVNLTYNGNI